MSFYSKDLFTAALHISAPWFISSINFDPEIKRLDVEVSFDRGSEFTITGDFGSYTGTAYDTREKSWRHLNFFEHECYINARVPRIKTPEGKVRLVKTPWEGKMNGFTLLFESLVLQLISCMPVLKVQKLTGVSDDKLWDLLHRYINEAISEMDLSELTQFGLDETSRAKGHEYISLFVDMCKRKIVYITTGKDHSVLERFAEFMKEHKGEPKNVTDVSIDMSKSFILGVNKYFSQANISFDPFHLMKNLNEAVNKTRILEQKEKSILKGNKYVVLKNEENLTSKQTVKLEELKMCNENLKTLRAMNIRIAFQDLLNTQTEDEFKELFKKWYYWATHSRIASIISVAKSFKKHYDGIISRIESGINNGILEGINSLIQAAKAKARGYKAPRNLIAIAYLIAGDLDLESLNKHYEKV